MSDEPRDWDASKAIAPPPGTDYVPCPVCGSGYLDYPAGRYAHLKVFGHPPPNPRTKEEDDQ